MMVEAFVRQAPLSSQQLVEAGLKAPIIGELAAEGGLRGCFKFKASP